MALILRIKSRDGQTAEVPISAGIIIGRAPSVQIQLDDPKLSARHAQIEINAKGQFILKDLGSTNGIRVNDQRVPQVELEPGARFRMGYTEFAVDEVKAQSKAKETEAPPKPPKSAKAVPKSAPPKVPMAEKTPAPPPPPPKWSDYFVKFVTASLKKIKDSPRPLHPFQRILKLNIIRGLQAETVWTLGYGPREIGPASVDLVLEESSAPPICFTVEADGPNIIFKTDHPQLVKLNEKSVKSDTLKSGDVISIAETRITVGFAE